MRYKVLYHNPSEDIVTRLLKIRNVDCSIDDFLNPSLQKYRLDPFLLSDMDKAVARLITAMQNNEKIMIFADYDVDGVTSSFMLYTFITKFVKYKHISIQYPDRLTDGYGIKTHHIDQIQQKGCSVIVTVDNGITAVAEAAHAKTLGIDLIITDHHEVADNTIPDAYAIVNPQTSPMYAFKGICGAGVTFKLINALMDRTSRAADKKRKIFDYFVPIVAISTIADCVPLVQENRALVKRGLNLINTKREHIPKSLQGLLEYLNITKPIDTYHVGFMIGPRINAGGRIGTPMDSLNILLYEGEKQLLHLDKLEGMNTERRKLQEQAYKIAEAQVNIDLPVILAASTEFHEGIIGIVAGRLSEKYHKPTVVFAINEEENKAVASLRGPDYFHVVKMLEATSDVLERFGGHKQAGGLMCKLENLDKVQERFTTYCANIIQASDLQKTVHIDTLLYPHEWDRTLLDQVSQLAPFGVGNEEPSFAVQDLQVQQVEKVGKNGNGHLKVYGKLEERPISVLFWGKGEMINDFPKENVTIVGRMRTDDFNGGYFLEGQEVLEEGKLEID